MSEWITDRLPTGYEIRYGKVWVTDNFGYVAMVDYKVVELGTPWQPIPKPEPYVKPKRWTVRWDNRNKSWQIIKDGNLIADTLYCLGGQSHRHAAERIADIYNEVMP